MRVSRGERVCVVATIASIRHTLDAPALEYVPATHEVHVAADDEVAPRWPYLPAAHAEPEHELAPAK